MGTTSKTKPAGETGEKRKHVATKGVVPAKGAMLSKRKTLATPAVAAKTGGGRAIATGGAKKPATATARRTKAATA